MKRRLYRSQIVVHFVDGDLWVWSVYYDSALRARVGVFLNRLLGGGAVWFIGHRRWV